MANIRAQSITPEGISITASDGRTYSLTRGQAIALFQAQSGGRNAKIAATIQLVKQQIVAALGPEQISLSELSFDFDDIRGLKHLAFGLNPDVDPVMPVLP